MNLIAKHLAQRSGGNIKPAAPLNHSPPVISVVIPCYNYGRYLPACVASVTDQVTHHAYLNVEIIIVDDASTDDSLQVARQLASQDSTIRLIEHETNKGHIQTYNDGIDAATGEYLLLLSADDLLTPGALARAVALLEAHPNVGIVYGTALHFSGDKLPPARQGGKEWIVWRGADWFWARCRDGYSVVASPEVLCRTSVLRQIGGYSSKLPHAGDFAMWLEMAALSDVGYLVDADQAYYRKHGTNMHLAMHKSGTFAGQLIDIQQRWMAFEHAACRFLLSPSYAASIIETYPAASITETYRTTLANEALAHIRYAQARGRGDEFPYEAFRAVARQLWPYESPLKERRGRLPFIFKTRLQGIMHRFRWARIGI